MQFIKGKTDCSPSEVGYDERRIDVLINHFDRLMKNGEIKCAMYAAARKGKIFMSGAIGPISYKGDAPLLPDSVNYIASITKTFTAIAIMKLVEDGLTRLDTPVGDILPEFKNPPFNEINLFHLLTHTSGMHPDGGVFPNKYQVGYWGLISNAMKLHDPKKGEFNWIAASLGNGVRDKPNKQWMYNSFGYALLGVVIEKLTGIHSHKYIEDYIAKPLGMNDTKFELTPDMAKRSIIHDEEHEGWLNSVVAGKVLVSENEKAWKKLDVPSTGGGLNSTVFDLIRFGNMMLNKGTLDGVRILGRKAVEKMTTYSIHGIPNYCWGANEDIRDYGVGFDMRKGIAFTFSEGTFMHEGAGACAIYMDPKEEMVATWFVPFADDNWHDKAQFNTQNVIWSGLI